MDTIFALSTVRGRAGVSVIRVSGPDAGKLLKSFGAAVPEARRASLRSLKLPSGDILDQAIVLLFPEGASYTGEEVVELHLHGGVATADAVLREIGSRPGCRLAEPGEFSLRALQSGRMSLAEIEGLADLVNSETEAQRKQARRLLDGELETRAREWRAVLTRSMALLEAVMEFADEDLPEDSTSEALGLLVELRQELKAELSGISVGERIRDGFEVAIVGEANVGKSTLLNRLAGREAALTSKYAGTTRDIVEVRMDVNGLPVTFLDTAGIRDTDDPVESQGIMRARERSAKADLRVYLVEVAGRRVGPQAREGDIELRAKADLLDDEKAADAVSGTTGQGVTEMLERVGQELAGRAALAGAASRERHRQSLSDAVAFLGSAISELEGDGRSELAVEDAKSAARSLATLLGEVDIEHVLDDLFSSLCIGK